MSGFSCFWCKSFLGALATVPFLSQISGEVIQVPAQHLTIQEAINAASDGDAVLVAEGVYIINEPIYLLKNIAMRSEGKRENTIIRMSENPKNPDTAVVIINVSGENQNPLIDGFTITGGKYGISSRNWLRSLSAISNCIITENHDAGIFLETCRVTNSTITNNRGDGVCVSGSGSTFQDCIIAENKGRGVTSCVVGIDVRLINCDISRNQRGAFSGMSTSFTLINCKIFENISDQDSTLRAEGGGLTTLTNCVITRNLSEKNILNISGGQTGLLTNCLITQNTAKGDIVWLDGELINCTVAKNFTDKKVIDYPPWIEFLKLKNCIIWDNTPNTFSGNADHCLTNEDPRFVDSINGDYHLEPDSPAIDAGTSEGAPATDIEGNSRQCGNSIDIGAYEFCLNDTLFIRGDANRDKRIDITDAIFILQKLFLEATPFPCEDAADVNDNGVLLEGVTDPLYLLAHLFLGGPAPPMPYPDLGKDTTDDNLGCKK